MTIKTEEEVVQKQKQYVLKTVKIVKRINNTTSEWKIEKFLYMRKEVLDRQKDLEKSNLEMVEKLRLSDEKFENLSNDLQSKMDKIVETLKPETISGIEQKIRLFDERIEKLSNEQHEQFVRLDMRKEFLDKQKDLEKSNSEIVEKVRACDERIENVSKELQSKMDKIHETLKTEVSSEIVEKIRLSDEKMEKLSNNFDSIQSKLNNIVEKLKPEAISGIEQKIRLCDEKYEKLSNGLQSKLDIIIETLKPEASSEVVEKIRLCDEKIEKLRKEHREKVDSIQSKLIEIVETVKPEVPKIVGNNDPATSGKYFVLKHTFNNVSSFENNKQYNSEIEEHFGVPWKISVKRLDGFLQLYLCTDLLQDTEKKWKIEVEDEMKIVSPVSKGKEEKIKGKSVVFKSDDNDAGWGYRKFMEWDELKNDFVVDDCFCAEIAMKVRKMTGIYKENLRSFDNSMAEYSDVVLIVNNEKFYVSKWILATHSPYFMNLFMKKSYETEKSEIKLSGIDADDFQNYLEVLHGKQAIDEFTVEGILIVAVRYHTRLVIEKCENFLMNESNKTLKKKLELSTRYKLAALMKQCIE